MKYEGKLYGKIAGKYIEVTDHVSNDDLIEQLESLIESCNEQAEVFRQNDMKKSEISSLSMATAYRNVISILTEQNVVVTEI